MLENRMLVGKRLNIINFGSENIIELDYIEH